MAKKKEEIVKVSPAKKTTSAKKEFKFSDLVNSLKKINEDSCILTESPFSKIENFIGLGNYLLNAQVSGNIFGGIPEGRTTIFASPEGCGKTFLCLNLAREAQQQGYKVVWIDTENALDIETTNKFGINPKEFNIVPIGTINETTGYITNLCDLLIEQKNKGLEIPKILIVVDSLGALSSDKEIKDAKDFSDKQDFTKSKELRKLFRVITKKAGILKIPIAATNHVYDSIGSFFPSKEQGGGGGPKYSASTILMLSKAKLKEKSDGPQTGIIVTSKINKSRFTKAGIDIKFFIEFNGGMNPYIGLMDYVDWDICGIGPGKIEKGKYIPDESDKPKTWAIKHLNKTLKKARDIFSPEVFTQEVLEKLAPVIKEVFEFQDNNSDYLDEVDELINEEIEEEGTE